MISTVNNARPDVLWVGMTVPKQEKWIYENRDKLNVPFKGAIGRYSIFMQALGNNLSVFG